MPRDHNPALIAVLLAGVLALGFFVWIAWEMTRGGVADFDFAIRAGVHAQASPALTYLMRGFTFVGSTWLLLPLGFLIAWRLAVAGRGRGAVLFVVATIGGEALDQFLKYWFRRPRPEAFFGLPEPVTYSFPSGHAVESTCFYGALTVILASRLASRIARFGVCALAAAWVAAIGLSRVYLGVHYPSDVVAGFSVGVFWLASVRVGYGVWLRRRAP